MTPLKDRTQAILDHQRRADSHANYHRTLEALRVEYQRKITDLRLAYQRQWVVMSQEELERNIAVLIDQYETEKKALQDTHEKEDAQ